ncbi:MAG: serine protease, partial [Patescibacteria group bacterium]
SLSIYFQDLTTTAPTPTTPSPDNLVTKITATIQKTSDATYRLYYFKDTYIGSAWSPKTKDFHGTILITAAHCVIGKTSNKPRSNFWWIGHPSWDPEKKLQFTLLSYDVEKDIAILFSMEKYELEELEISATSPKFVDPLIVIANPPGSTATPIIGNYLSKVVIPKQNKPCDLITNHTRPGCSGAPVVTIEGAVVTMVQGVLQFQSNGFTVGSATPRDIIIETLESARIRPAIKE